MEGKKIKSSTEITVPDIGSVAERIAFHVFEMEERILREVLVQALGRAYQPGDEKRLSKVISAVIDLSRNAYDVFLDGIHIGNMAITAFPEISVTFNPDKKYL